VTFVMVARHFVDNEELVGLLTQYQDSPTQFMKVFRITVRRRRTEPSAFGQELSRPGRQREVVGEAAFGAS
jgi:hypothetical protein